MLTRQEILFAILAPVAVATAIAAMGRWRRWPWAMPLATGAGYLLGYALLGAPAFPPHDGIDWLFWLAIPLTVLGVIDSAVRPAWGWLFGVSAGLVAWVVLTPLAPVSLSYPAIAATALLVGLTGAALILVLDSAQRSIGPRAVSAGLCITLGGAAVVVLSSNIRVLGVYGMAASAALAPLVILAPITGQAGRGVAIVAVPLLAGLLVAGRHYADPGVSGAQCVTLFAAPALLLIGRVLPRGTHRVRSVISVAAVAIAVALVSVPAALAAKRAAEADPYASRGVASDISNLTSWSVRLSLSGVAGQVLGRLG